eukprot:15411894-Alexandrium_andersonii.AAC.1
MSAGNVGLVPGTRRIAGVVGGVQEGPGAWALRSAWNADADGLPRGRRHGVGVHVGGHGTVGGWGGRAGIRCLA